MRARSRDPPRRRRPPLPRHQQRVVVAAVVFAARLLAAALAVSPPPPPPTSAPIGRSIAATGEAWASTAKRYASASQSAPCVSSSTTPERLPTRTTLEAQYARARRRRAASPTRRAPAAFPAAVYARSAPSGRTASASGRERRRRRGGRRRRSVERAFQCVEHRVVVAGAEENAGRRQHLHRERVVVGQRAHLAERLRLCSWTSRAHSSRRAPLLRLATDPVPGTNVAQPRRPARRRAGLGRRRLQPPRREEWSIYRPDDDVGRRRALVGQ